jgi:hypothetical protein
LIITTKEKRSPQAHYKLSTGLSTEIKSKAPKKNQKTGKKISFYQTKNRFCIGYPQGLWITKKNEDRRR